MFLGLARRINNTGGIISPAVKAKASPRMAPAQQVRVDCCYPA